MGELKEILENTAGINIGSEKVFVAVEGKPVCIFRTFTSSYK